ncbi:MAG: hypothetical protein EXR75_02285 [Myxococcales bacterium]|nr:hypothetical protein [Myxococcales bacterium]
MRPHGTRRRRVQGNLSLPEARIGESRRRRHCTVRPPSCRNCSRHRDRTFLNSNSRVGSPERHRSRCWSCTPRTADRSVPSPAWVRRCRTTPCRLPCCCSMRSCWLRCWCWLRCSCWLRCWCSLRWLRRLRSRWRRLVHCRLAHCRLAHCRLAHCRLAHCRLVHCRLVHCRLAPCRLVHWHLALRRPGPHHPAPPRRMRCWRLRTCMRHSRSHPPRRSARRSARRPDTRMRRSAPRCTPPNRQSNHQRARPSQRALKRCRAPPMLGTSWRYRRSCAAHRASSDHAPARNA